MTSTSRLSSVLACSLVLYIGMQSEPNSPLDRSYASSNDCSCQVVPWQTTGFEDGVRWTGTELSASLGVLVEGGAGGYPCCRTAADDDTTVWLEWYIDTGWGNGAGVHAQLTTEFDGSGNQALVADLHGGFDCTACTLPPN
jgi:hypothetical protein